MEAMVSDVRPGEDIIDFRNITDRVEVLELLRQSGPVDLGNDEDNETDQDELFAELAALEALLDETRGYGGDHQWRGDWYPGAIILDSYMEEYAQETAEDIGAISKEYSWPSSHIDWAAATDAFKQDYSSVSYGGFGYWYR
jgi:hypothetical protein